MSLDTFFYTERKISDRVQLAASSIATAIDSAFWISERAVNRAVVVLLQNAGLSNVDVDDLIVALARMGYAERFFRLVRARNDSADHLYDYLKDRQVRWETVLVYFERNAFDPIEFSAGLLVGVGWATIQMVVDTIKLAWEVSLPNLAFGTTVDDVLNFLTTLRTALRQTPWMSMLVTKLEDTARLQRDLFLRTDYFRAGVLIGELALTLYILIEAAVLLARILGTIAKGIFSLASLFAEGVGYVTVTLAELVASIGIEALAVVERIGAEVLAAIVDLDRFVQWLKSSVRAFNDGLGNIFLRLTGLPSEEFAFADVGPSAELVLWGRVDMPWKLLVVQSRLAVDDLIAGVERVIDAWGRGSSTDLKPPASVVEAAEAANALQRAEGLNLQELKDLAQRIRDDLLAELLASGESTDTMKFGRTVHDRISLEVHSLPSINGKYYRVHSEMTIGDLAESLGFGGHPTLDMKLLEWLESRPNVVRQLARGSDRLIDLVHGYGYTRDTSIMRLKNDLVLLGDPVHSKGQAIVIDFTSDNKIGMLEKRLDELRTLSKGGILSPQAAENMVNFYANHAQVTMVIRREILAEILSVWDWSAGEVYYGGVSREPGVVARSVKGSGVK